MSLFSKINKEGIGFPKYAEPAFHRLCHGSKHESRRVRGLLERWFQQYPGSEQNDLRSRFSSSEDGQHWGAFFELYCFALVRAMGYSVEVHKSVERNSKARVDITAKATGEIAFYLECTTTEDPWFNRGEQARLDRVLNTLDAIQLQDFFIGVEVHSAPKQEIRLSKLRHFVAAKFEDLDALSLLRSPEIEGLDAMPRWEYVDSGCRLTLFPVPVQAGRRTPRLSGSIGLVSYGARWAHLREHLLNSLKSKARKYGKPEAPFIVAVHAVEPVEDIDVMDALFGQHSVVLYNGRIHHETRQPNGLWVSAKGPRNTRVSAVMVGGMLTPYSIAAVTPVLWHNPWAGRQLEADMWSGPQMVADEQTSQMKLGGGRRAWEILGLHQDWPRE